MKRIQPGSLVAKEQFELVGNSPDAWRSVAADLLVASEALERLCRQAATSDRRHVNQRLRGRVGKITLMLRGMAIECLLKSAWIKRGNKLVVRGQFHAPIKGRSHHLPTLASAAKFPLSQDETFLTERLSHFIEYGGRYPVPRTEQTLCLVKDPKGGYSAATTWSVPTDDRLFRNLVRRIRSTAG